MYRRMIMCTRADTAADMAVDTETIMISAGEACEEACVGAGCEAAGETASLPHVHFEEQVYVYGFTPEEALQRGTMFPELVN